MTQPAERPLNGAHPLRGRRRPLRYREGVRILLVDDHRDVRELVKRALESDGHVVVAVGNLAAAKRALGDGRVDFAVLDLGLPDGDGIDLCRSLRREESPIPVLLLTARSEVAQRVAGLDAGADDYLTKPFAVAELRARVRALARRPTDRTKSIVSVDDVILDFGQRSAQRAGHAAALTAREWAILELLAARRGRVASKVEILDSVWGEVTDKTESSLEVLVARIRRKLGERVVRTVRGEGYAFHEA